VHKKPAPPPDDPEQSKRFEEAARELDVDESGEAFERLLDTVLPKPPQPEDPKQTPKKRG
jgi:hypothetical protein